MGFIPFLYRFLTMLQEKHHIFPVTKTHGKTHGKSLLWNHQKARCLHGVEHQAPRRFVHRRHAARVGFQTETTQEGHAAGLAATRPGWLLPCLAVFYTCGDVYLNSVVIDVKLVETTDYRITVGVREDTILDNIYIYAHYSESFLNQQ